VTVPPWPHASSNRASSSPACCALGQTMSFISALKSRWECVRMEHRIRETHAPLGRRRRPGCQLSRRAWIPGTGREVRILARARVMNDQNELCPRWGWRQHSVSAYQCRFARGVGHLREQRFKCPRSHRRCRAARPDLGERWPSRLVAAAAEDCLSEARAVRHHRHYSAAQVLAKRSYRDFARGRIAMRRLEDQSLRHLPRLLCLIFCT
jgi:hypothetical protein